MLSFIFLLANASLQPHFTLITFKIHVSNLITVKLFLFIKLQLIINAKNILHLNQCTHGHIWSRTVAPFSMVPEQLSMVWQASKILWWSVSSFESEVNTLETLSVPIHKNVKYWGRANVVALPQKLNFRGRILLWIFFLVLVWGNSLLKFVQAFWKHSVHIHTCLEVISYSA